MSDAVIGLVVVTAVATLLGAGWSSLLADRFLPGTLGFLFRSWVCAIAIESLVTTWCYVADISGSWIAVVIAAVSAAGYLLPRRKIPRVLKRDWIGLAIAIVVTLIAIVPAVASPTRLTVAQRIGPDAVGYAISARAVSSGETRHEIQAELLAETGAPSVQQAMSPVTHRVDSTASFSVQVVNEFMSGAARWALPMVAGTAVALLGVEHLWSVLSLLAAFGLLTAMLGIYVLVLSLGRTTSGAILAMFLVGMNSAVLNDWHEGGLAEL